MTTVLLHKALVSNQASVADCLRACGAQLWSAQAVKRYKSSQRIRHIGIYAWQTVTSAVFRRAWVIGLIMSCLMLSLFGASGVLWVCGLYGCIVGIALLNDIPSWKRNYLFLHGKTYRYSRDFQQASPPEEAVTLIKNVQAFFPNTTFAVSFLGRDPILDCEIEGAVYYILVWDEHLNRSTSIVPPPK
ncbi:MAG: hypothetical protein JWO43_187 [Candidatus Adlerbacteria bacterium]|nr:hypothetical protein [Candidatus Adlerbacteria bacterium]